MTTDPARISLDGSAFGDTRVDVDASLKSVADDPAELRRRLNDLVSIMALPALWAGGEPPEIVTTLVGALVGALPLAFVFARVNDPDGGSPFETVRVAESMEGRAREIRRAIDVSRGDWASNSALHSRIFIGDVQLALASARLGLQGEIGVLVAGSETTDFPAQTEQLILDVAANQAAIALQQARLVTERTRRANESERESRLIVDSIPGLVALLSPTGDVEVVNRPLLEYFGQTLEELRQWGTNGTVHPEDLPHVVEVFTRAIASGTPYEIVQRLRRRDGVYRWIQNSGFPLRDTAGQIVRWCVLLTDIDERKRAETQLAGEIRLLDMVACGSSLTDVLNALCCFVEDTATNCHCGVYLIDWRGPTFQNAAAPTLPSSFNDPIDGLPVRREIGPCARAACLRTQVIAADIESDPLWQASPFRDLALTNGLRSCWSTPIYSLAGQVLGTFAIYQRTPGRPTPLLQDLIAQVTHIASIAIERAQSETALKRSEAFLADGQRLSLTGSFSWRVATDEITWSEQLYRIYQIEIGTPVTLDLIRTRVHPEDVSLLEKMKMIDQARAGDDEFEWQYRLLMPDHSVKYLHAVAHAIRNQDSQLEYIAAVQDVTERRVAEEALAKARSELAKVARATSLSALTASIAHEINQPLSGIITNASTCLRMLNAHPPDVDGARETAKRTIRDGNRASEVVTRLRALFSKREFTLERLDLNEATRDVIALSSNELQRNRILLQPELADDLPTITGDRIQLQQVILNLLRNGSDAMGNVHDRPRQLLIKTEREKADRIRLTVRDVGVGLPPQSLTSLFDAFYTTKSGGMGIGLFVSRSIIERHHGRLWAEPNDRGPGATFSFSLPLSADGVPNGLPAGTS